MGPVAKLAGPHYYERSLMKMLYKICASKGMGALGNRARVCVLLCSKMWPRGIEGGCAPHKASYRRELVSSLWTWLLTASKEIYLGSQGGEVAEGDPQ